MKWIVPRYIHQGVEISPIRSVVVLSLTGFLVGTLAGGRAGAALGALVGGVVGSLASGQIKTLTIVMDRQGRVCLTCETRGATS